MDKKRRLMLMGKKHPYVRWKRKGITNHKDILVLEGICFGKKKKIVLVYFYSIKTLKERGYVSNRRMEKEVERKRNEGENRDSSENTR